MNKTISALLLSAALMTACKTSAPTSQEKPPLPTFDLEGHRGARGLMPENTIPAMRKAIDLGMTTLEMDAHITRDNQVIIAHDDYFNPLFALTPDGKEIPKEDAKKYALYQMDYAQIKTFDVGSRFYGNFPKQQKMKAHVPLLVDLIDSVQAYLKANNKPQMFYNIETKSKLAGDHKLHPDPENFVKLLMGVIEQKKITPWVIIQSFDPRTLQVMRQKYPEVRTSLLVENKKTLEENLKTLGYTPTIYSPNYKLVTAELVKKCHDLGIKVIPWTVNTPEEITQMKALGVDGIISDYPNLLAARQQ
jgi:glycerophosphoryl diester phosphodiesterase